MEIIITFGLKISIFNSRFRKKKSQELQKQVLTSFLLQTDSATLCQELGEMGAASTNYKSDI